jgi:hypothetical protein
MTRKGVGMMQLDVLICQFCGDTTTWPNANEIEMMVYGIAHIAETCSEAPADVKAEAIVMWEAARQGELAM